GLGNFYYALWILAGNVTEYYGLLDVGMRTTMQRFVARYEGTHQRDSLNATFANALMLTTGIALLICLISISLSRILPSFFSLHGDMQHLFSKLIILLGSNVAVTLIARLLGSYVCGLQRFDLYNL